MKDNLDYNLGIMFRREHAPENLPAVARQAETAGFDELWMVEDCFYGSGIASAAAAMACTASIKVGVGIMPAVSRNPVFVAMEIATLSRLYPGRFLPGLGHGMAGWMRQIGAFPKSQLKALGETTLNIRALLTGEAINFEGEYVQLDQARLLYPPGQIPPISLGVRGPKSLSLSGRVADGTILAEFSSPAYVSWARAQIAAGAQAAGHELRGHRLTVFVWTCLDSGANSAREQLRPLIAKALASESNNAHFTPMGILPEVQEYLGNGGLEHLETAMPDTWTDQLSIAGTPEETKSAVHHLVEAGADTVVLVPLPDKGVDELDVFAQHFLG